MTQGTHTANRYTIVNQRLMTWSGIIGLALLLAGMWAFAGFVPPPGPNATIEQIVTLYTDRGVFIRIGMIIACGGITLLAPWITTVAIQIQRIEGEYTPLAFIQLMLGGVLLVEFYIPSVVWEVAAFRPQLNPALTYSLHDLGAILFVALPISGALQAIILGIAIFQDKRDEPVFPRWLGYLSIWAAMSFIPGSLNSLAKEGILAWSGVLAWWVALTAFGSWILSVCFCLLRYTIPHHQRQMEKST